MQILPDKIGTVKLQDGSEVAFLELVDDTDSVAVQSTALLDTGDELETLMDNESPRIKSSPIQDPQKGEVQSVTIRHSYSIF